MSESRGAPLPLRARVVVGVVAVAGVAVALRSAVTLVRGDLPIQWILFATLTIASGMLSLKLPAVDSTRFSISEGFAFASVLLFGPDVGVVTLALDGIRISCRWKMNLAQTVFNFANLALSMWAAGYLFFFASGARPLYFGAALPSSILLCLLLMTAAYYAVNSGLIAAVVGLSSGRAVLSVWREHYLRLFPSYLAGAAVAMLLALAYREVRFTAIALSVPFVLICYFTLRSSFGRLDDAKRHVDELNGLLLSTVETLATAIDAKDEITHDHVRRVQRGSLGLARALGVTDATMLQAIEAAALLHDTGKIAVPEHILNKPGRLTPAEFEKMKQHAPIGAEILSSIAFPYPVVPIVRHHHENWDGSGYPDGLKGDAIPLGARILSVIDCFDALTSDRPYRRRMTDAQAVAILRERRGVMYDPLIVDTFLADHARVMPPYDPTPHPASRVIGDARANDRETRVPDTVPVLDPAGAESLLAMTSLSRALTGEARVGDVGALLWAILQPVLPCEAMAIFVPDVIADQVTARYAAGRYPPRLRGLARATGAGVAGWVAVTRRAAINADPVLDLGLDTGEGVSALRSCLAIPIGSSAEPAGVLALYRAESNAFTDDHLRLLELLAGRVTGPLSLAMATDQNDAPLQTGPVALVRRSRA
jgi:putative nucleotidyltransferase with HDIG domain